MLHKWMELDECNPTVKKKICDPFVRGILGSTGLPDVKKICASIVRDIWFDNRAIYDRHSNLLDSKKETRTRLKTNFSSNVAWSSKSRVFQSYLKFKTCHRF